MATILIVDDHARNREFLTTLLSYGNHRLLDASDGAKALELVRSDRPDLVISDILMPTMDGLEFARQLHRDPAIAHTPIIFYTATYQVSQVEGPARACGVQHILQK